MSLRRNSLRASLPGRAEHCGFGRSLALASRRPRRH